MTDNKLAADRESATVALREHLEAIHRNLQRADNWPDYGICDNLTDRLSTRPNGMLTDASLDQVVVLNELMARWPKSSGSHLFPVPSTNGWEDAEGAYLMSTPEGRWDWRVSEYARSRWELLEWLIDEIGGHYDARTVL